ncbi:MAG: methylated-DNA--[protein]-cysteine S-methyltransferase [Planctomycetia bacterium]|nr:methylated-DNA--[protein]-cysteine S-methyltransferase [Planctomycetia bacterium]
MEFRKILTPLGTLTLWAHAGTLIRLDWDGIFSETHAEIPNETKRSTPDDIKGRIPDSTKEDTEILEAEEQILNTGERILKEYFSGKRVDFNLLPMNPTGTDFQQKVWTALRKIPYGETVSYGEIARRIGSPKAARAVGMANHVNPLPIFIPCHRVVGSNGKLTGYAPGLKIKRILLELEAGVQRLQYPTE